MNLGKLTPITVSGMIATALSFAACTHMKYGFATNPVPGDASELARGKALFEAQCAACHGTDARGTGAAAATLPAPPTNLVEASPGWSDGVFHIRMIARPKNGMPSFKESMSEDERWHVIRYVRSLSPAQRL